MKNILILGGVLFTSMLFAQNEAKQLSPKWEKGLITEYQGSYNYMGHDLNENDVRTYLSFNLDFEIVQDEKDQFIIRSKVPNIVLIEALDLANNSRADFSVFQEVDVFYSYNKSTGATQLLNWESLSQIYTEAKSEMSKYVRYYPQKLMRLESLFKELDLVFKNEKEIQKAYKEQISWFTSFLNKNLILDKASKSSIKITNPFFNDEVLKGNSESTVNEINKETKSFTYIRDITIKADDYKNTLTNYLKTKKGKNTISEKEKDKLNALALTTYQPDFMEYSVVNYETTLPITLKLEYKLDEKSGNKAVRTYKRVIIINKKK